MSITLTPQIVRLIAEIDEFKGYWRGVSSLSTDALRTLRMFATIESIGSSTRIEGAKLSNSEVEMLLRGIDIHSFRNRDEEEVAGYADAMRLITESFAEIDLTENHVKQLHKILLAHSSKDQWHLGEYKQHPNHVSAFDETGHEVGVIFETSSPLETPHLMRELIADIGQRLRAESEHPLLTISEFTVRFLAIHPFQDGNGRVSRVLTNLLLLRAGYDYVQYSSLEQQIELQKQDYYLALRKTQLDLCDPAWNEFFLLTLKRQKDRLLERVESQREQQSLPIPEAIIRLVKERGRITMSDVVSHYRFNRNTIKKHLEALVRSGQLIPHGKGRGVYYTIV